MPVQPPADEVRCEVKIRGEVCGRPLQRWAGYCSGHYKDHLSGRPFRPLKTARGFGAKLVICLPIDLKVAAQVAADKEGITESEWWRRAAKERLRPGRRSG